MGVQAKEPSKRGFRRKSRNGASGRTSGNGSSETSQLSSGNGRSSLRVLRPQELGTSNGHGAAGVRLRGNGTRVRSADEVTVLVERAKSNDREAFGDLYRMYHPPIYRLASFYLGNAADDAVAETFMRAWAAIPRYQERGRPFVSWLYAIARHVVADEMNGRRRVEPRAEVPDRPITTRIDDRMDLSRAMARLPQGQRRLLELKFLLGLTNAEICALSQKTIVAVKAQQWRALRKMRELLQEEDEHE